MIEFNLDDESVAVLVHKLPFWPLYFQGLHSVKSEGNARGLLIIMGLIRGLVPVVVSLGFVFVGEFCTFSCRPVPAVGGLSRASERSLFFFPSLQFYP